ncbi:MAG: hypothetical protein H6835_00320 [Planctomycetes bacterium]|nr:hypothetical protein [Planctomycetota bacterium]
MIAPEFLALLVCPVTREPLREARAAELAAVNAAIAAGGAQDRGGTALTAPVEEGLCTSGGAWLYPIRDGLPVLLGAAAIPVPAS